jgi:hypothetical protein
MKLSRAQQNLKQEQHMDAINHETISLTQLQENKKALEERINKIESDMKLPLEATFSEQAGQLSNRMILTRLLDIERSNLQKLNVELARRGR